MGVVLRRATLVWLTLLALSCAAGTRSDPREPQQPLFTPAEVYGELFAAVQLAGVYADGKTFADAIPVTTPAKVLAAYIAARTQPAFSLAAFVRANFITEVPPKALYRAVPGASAGEHIDRLWPVLTRPADAAGSYSSRIALPHRYVVPGDRFRELYYWDSYFTMLGLLESGRHDLVEDMVKNFAWLIDRFGHIPNGSRTYYVSRSQPPFFALMVELLAEREGPAAYARFRVQLEREYAFWMDGSATLAPNQAHRRVVRLSDGSLLNRYWDDKATPRDESYLEDVQTARASDRPA
ncbi:MAG TPA: trehalase family glycosidase, partial [Polyangiales bacterium]